MAETVKDIIKRANWIWNQTEYWRRGLKDIHDQIIPLRKPQGGFDNNNNMMDKIFDGTAVKSMFRFGGRMQQDLTPPFERFFNIEPGPLVPKGDQRKGLTEELAEITELSDAILGTGEWHTGSHSMYLDMFAGQGAMLILPGERGDLARFMAISNIEVALQIGPFQNVIGVVWKRKYLYEQLEELFPEGKRKGKFPVELNQRIKRTPRAEIVVTQYTRRNPKNAMWEHMAFVKGFDTFIDEQTFRINPWLVPRFFVLPGEAHGRGLAHIALPFVKTANKARELALKAALFSLLGVWMAHDDGVFNPDTSRFVPGTFWKVASTGGARGPSLARLPVPDNFDVSSIVLNDERDQIKQATLDDTLPPIAGAVRSPTEIVERMARLDFDWAGVDGRLHLEIVAPLIVRVIDLLENKRILPTKLTIDQLLVRINVTSPITRARRAQVVKPTVEWLEILGQIGGPQFVALTARIEKIGADLGRNLGVKEEDIRSDAEKAEIQKLVANMLAASQGAGAAAQSAEGLNGSEQPAQSGAPV